MNKIINSSLALASICYTSFISAHDISGSLGNSTSGAVATDIWSVECYNDGSGVPTKLFAQVKDAQPILKPTISIQITKTVKGKTQKTSINTDTKDGDTKYSTGVSLKPTSALGGGIGAYNFVITKSQTSPIVTGTEVYAVKFHCQTKTNSHTGTEYSQIENH